MVLVMFLVMFPVVMTPSGHLENQVGKIFYYFDSTLTQTCCGFFHIYNILVLQNTRKPSRHHRSCKRSTLAVHKHLVKPYFAPLPLQHFISILCSWTHDNKIPSLDNPVESHMNCTVSTTLLCNTNDEGCCTCPPHICTVSPRSKR